MTRYRDLGLTVGQLPPARINAITDVDGVARRRHHPDRGRRPARRRPGSGSHRRHGDRSPRRDRRASPCSPGCHRLNGNGELTGLEWVRESGQLTTPVAITNTHSVGVVRDAHRRGRHGGPRRHERVTGACRSSGRPGTARSTTSTASTCGPSTWTQRSHARRDRAGARGQRRRRHRHDLPRVQGRDGHGVAPTVADGGWTVGALVQANYGRRERLTVDGVPVGREIGPDGRARRRGTTDERCRRPTARARSSSIARDRRAAAAPSARAPRPARRPGHRARRRRRASIPAATSSWRSPPANRGRLASYKDDGRPGPVRRRRCCPTRRSARCSGPRSRPPRKRS